MVTHAAIVPLIGGLPLGQSKAFGNKPEYILTYEPFKNNDQHIVHYWNNVKYSLVGESVNSVDVVGTTCPCAGLSSLSPSANSNAAANDWMSTTAKYVLESIQPRVFWGENAPRLASKMGEPVVEKLRKIGEENGYTFSIYKTKSILHGLSQVRDRTFYFFWKENNRIPVFDYFSRSHERIEDTIRNTKFDKNDPMSVLANSKKPTDNPFYQYVLKEIEGGITHEEFSNKIEKTTNPLDYIEFHGITYDVVGEWMQKCGYEREAAKCTRMYEKLKSGGNIMRKNTEIPKDYIGAFVGHLPTSLTHPDEDRYLTIRECLNIMKMPEDFILQGGVKNLNHICQNVPVTTAADMAGQVKKYLDGKLDYVSTDFMIQCNKSQQLNYTQQLEVEEW
jgi:site-specific DNA-cytosine methylase